MNLITSASAAGSEPRIAAVGMYDGVHLGHRFLIDFLRHEGGKRGLRPAVVTFSRHPLSLVRPLEVPASLTPLDDRVQLLADAGAEDIILLAFNNKLRRLSAREFLAELKSRFNIRTLVLGFNNRLGHDRPDTLAQYEEIGRSLGMEIVQAPEYQALGQHVSSSAIRRCLADRKPGDAATLLGRPYSLRGTVVRGKQFGRTIGFPTANITPTDPAALVPAPGVYAVRVITPDGVRRPAMLNIGQRPTVADASNTDSPITIEAHIIDYNGCLYDEEISIEFIQYLRPETHFDTPALLARQLRQDRTATLKICPQVGAR